MTERWHQFLHLVHRQSKAIAGLLAALAGMLALRYLEIEMSAEMSVMVEAMLVALITYLVTYLAPGNAP